MLPPPEILMISCQALPSTTRGICPAQPFLEKLPDWNAMQNWQKDGVNPTIVKTILTTSVRLIALGLADNFRKMAVIRAERCLRSRHAPLS
jgi:hypothetical protein